MPSFPRLLLPRLLPRAWARYFPRWDGTCCDFLSFGRVWSELASPPTPPHHPRNTHKHTGHNVQASQVFVPRLPKTASTEGGTATSSTADAVPLLPWGFVPQSLVRARVAPLRLALAAPRHTDKKGGQQGQQEHQEQEDDHYQTVLLGTHHTNPGTFFGIASLCACVLSPSFLPSVARLTSPTHHTTHHPNQRWPSCSRRCKPTSRRARSRHTWPSAAPSSPVKISRCARV